MSRRTQRRARRILIGAAAAAVTLGAVAAPSQAQGDPPPAPPTNFSMAGIKDFSQMQALAVDEQVTGDFQFCKNLNGLGAELYLNGGNGAGMTVRHATVTPFVVPIHVGLLKIYNPDPEHLVDEEMVTLGVAQGDPVQFGESGEATVEFGGAYFGTIGVGMVSWNYTSNITCTDSVVMPIVEPLINPGGGGTTTTTTP